MTCRYIYVFIYRNMVNEFLDRGRVPPVNMDVSECARMFGQVSVWVWGSYGPLVFAAGC